MLFVALLTLDCLLDELLHDPFFRRPALSVSSEVQIAIRRLQLVLDGCFVRLISG